MKYPRKIPLGWSGLQWWFFLLLPMVACAKVADPLPPPPRATPVVRRLEALVEGDRKLVFRLWVDAESPLERVLFYRGCPPDRPLTRSGVVPVEVSAPGSDFWQVEFPEPPSRNHCRYAVRVAAGGGVSPLSPELLVGPPRNPPPPVVEAPEVREQVVVFRWSPPEPADAVVGYLVNGRRFREEPWWEVRDFSFDEPIGIRVQTVATGPPVWHLSLPAEMSVIPRDTFAPEAPRDLAAVAVPGGVQLVWRAVTAPDLQVYRVYRRSGGTEGNARLLAEVPLNRFLDREWREELGGAEYWVTAVDTHGNESSPSPSVTMVDDAGRQPE